MPRRTIHLSSSMGYIDTTQLHLRKAQLLSGKAVAESKRHNIPEQVASLRQQIASQRSELVRFTQLLEEGAATAKQVDDLKAQIAVLERQLSAQTTNLQSGNRAVAGESSSLDAQIMQLEDQIANSIIASPITGTVLAQYAEEGELATAGRALFKVADLTKMYLRAYITADQLTNVKIGQQVRVYADDGQSDRREYSGVVSWISDRAEFTPKTIQTRDERANLVYAIKVAVVGDGLIKRGMYGEIKL